MIDDYADVLADVAVELAGRVRTDPPGVFAAWLHDQATRGGDPVVFYRDLAVILAAALPDDRPWSALTAWARLRHLAVVGVGRPDTPERIVYRRLDLVGGDPQVVAAAVAGGDPGRELSRVEREAVITLLWQQPGHQPLPVIAGRAQCSVRTVQRLLTEFGVDDVAA